MLCRPISFSSLPRSPSPSCPLSPCIHRLHIKIHKPVASNDKILTPSDTLVRGMVYFVTPAVGLMVFRLKIGLFSGLFVCFDFYTRTELYLIKTHLLPVSHISLAPFHHSFTQNRKHCSLANPILIHPLPHIPPSPSELQTPWTSDCLDLDPLSIDLFWLSACE